MKTPVIEEPTKRLSRTNWVLPAFVFFVGSGLTLLAYVSIKHNFSVAEGKRFQAMNQSLSDHILQRVHEHEKTLYGMRGLFSASKWVDRGEWRSFISSFDLREYPSSLGNGFIRKVNHDSIVEFLAETRADGAPDFEIHNSTPGPYQYVFTYLEPESVNRATVGLDISFDPHRKEAAEFSAIQNEVIMTRSFRLSYDNFKSQGFLMLLPVYLNDVPHATMDERKHALFGWVCVIIRIDELMKGFWDEFDQQIDFFLEEVVPGENRVPLFSAGSRTTADDKKFQAILDFAIGGQVWNLQSHPTQKFISAGKRSLPLLVLSGGLIISILSAGLALALVRTRTRAFNLAHTITASLRKSETELHAAKLAAEEANQEKSDLLASMSHEIRTPLNGVIGLACLLRDSKLQPTQMELVENILNSGEILLNLINDILDFSKIDASEVQIEKIPFNIIQTLKGIFQLLTVQSKTKGLYLKFEPLSSTPSFAVGDEHRFKQVVFNLVGNAIKFTSTGGVTITTEQENGLFKLRVIDTGMGIPKDKYDRIFRKFTQVDHSTTRRFGGTGLGLVISQRLIDLMGGTIGFESTLGTGSTFWFTLPVIEKPLFPAKDTMAETEIRSNPQDIGSNSSLAAGIRVLVAEDNQVNQMVVLGMLKTFGCEAVLAKNGIEAMEFAGESRFDLILMDCSMPEMDGYTATRAIRTKETTEKIQHVPIIALTAGVLHGDREKCLDAGMDDYLAKPFKVENLRKMLLKHYKA